MSGDLTRRMWLAASAAFMLPTRSFGQALPEQGFAGLGQDASGFAKVTPGRAFNFPDDHGPHPDFRIEWWYVTANLADASGGRYGVQWTLFRQAMLPHDQGPGWDSRQVWMGHVAATSATAHRFAETVSRGGVGTAGATAAPFAAWIDAWELRGLDGFDPHRVAPMQLAARTSDFSIDLKLKADAPLALQGDGGFSVKSASGQASYYYSQPFFRAAGRIAIDGTPVDVSGQAWLDREWSSQPLSGDQRGWDWLSLHLGGGDKLMLFRLRDASGGGFLSGNWIAGDAGPSQLAAGEIALTPVASTRVSGRDVPTSWRVAVASRGFDVTLAPLNAQSWMATRFPYWEGPISFSGSHSGVGYLEMTGY